MVIDDIKVWTKHLNSSNDLTLPLRKMQTDVCEQTMQWSSPCWEARALPPQASPLISAVNTEHGVKGGRSGPATAWRPLWPPHQTGHTSNCGARSPWKSCCCRCRNHCRCRQPCPSPRKPHCPGSCRPSGTRRSTWLCRAPAPGWNVGILVWSCSRAASGWAPDSGYLLLLLLLHLIELCRSGFMRLAGTSFWGDRC